MTAHVSGRKKSQTEINTFRNLKFFSNLRAPFRISGALRNYGAFRYAFRFTKKNTPIKQIHLPMYLLTMDVCTDQQAISQDCPTEDVLINQQEIPQDWLKKDVYSDQQEISEEWPTKESFIRREI